MGASLLRLHKIAWVQDPKRLDICDAYYTGQNWDNFVTKYLLAATIERIDLKFFVKGHMKKEVDRGFGSREEMYISSFWFHAVSYFNLVSA